MISNMQLLNRHVIDYTSLIITVWLWRDNSKAENFEKTMVGCKAYDGNFFT